MSLNTTTASDAVLVNSSQHAAPSSNSTRPCANFRPSIWADIFLQFDSQSMDVNDNMMKQQIQIYKEEVKKMFVSSTSNNIPQRLNFIDIIQRLGICYHFEHEINEALEQIHCAFINNNLTTEECGLHHIALLFRLLRQKGYRISSDIFNKFKNSKGKFNETIAQDVEGMWSLYEAAQLRVHGEDILDEALDFTYANLKSMIKQLSPSLAAQIHQSLGQPLHMGVPRIGARCFMSFYQQDHSHNELLLTIAKLDFNMLQKLHQKEVGNITKWWKKSDFATKVPYARDRVVEAYFWPLATSYEPTCSTARRMVGKLMACMSLLDDTYDAYGTVHELDLFTEAIKRWDISPIESLPECMKVVFRAILELWNEIELVIIAEGGNSSLVLQHIKQAFCKLAQAYMVEAKWCHEGYIPTYDEYKLNGVVSSTLPLQMTAFLGLGGFPSKQVFDWIISNPPIVKAVSLLGRLKDDIGSHKFEQERVHVASAVECCMKQYDISEEEAYKMIHKETEDFWKDINEGCLKSDDVPKAVLGCILNLARIIEFTYANFEDKYTNGELLKDYVVALLLDPTII